MSNKTPVSGTVVAVADERKAFKIGDKWFSMAQKSEAGLPGKGSTISFDAYGQNQNIVYRYIVQGELSNATATVAKNGVASNHRPVAGDTRSLAGTDLRSSALMAAATLLQHSEGSVEQVASNTVTVARIFEVYLGGNKTVATDDDDDGTLYWISNPADHWVAPAEINLGMEDN